MLDKHYTGYHENEHTLNILDEERRGSQDSILGKEVENYSKIENEYSEVRH
jgi:hypothetical protein